MKFLKPYPATEFYDREHFPEPIYLEIECNENEWNRIHQWLNTNLIFDTEYEPPLSPTPKFLFQFNTSIMPADRQDFYNGEKWALLLTDFVKEMFFSTDEKVRQTIYDDEKKLMWFRIMFFFGVEDAVLFRMSLSEKENN